MNYTIGNKLRILRLSRHYTQEELSDRLHMDRSAISNYETDRRVPSIETILLFADFYQVRTDYLIRPDFSGNPSRHLNAAEQFFEDFCRFTPEIQNEIINYARYLTTKAQSQ